MSSGYACSRVPQVPLINLLLLLISINDRPNVLSANVLAFVDYVNLVSVRGNVVEFKNSWHLAWSWIYQFDTSINDNKNFNTKRDISKRSSPLYIHLTPLQTFMQRHKLKTSCTDFQQSGIKRKRYPFSHQTSV